jgi:tetratricopeptide (TPR) repeat protein
LGYVFQEQSQYDSAKKYYEASILTDPTYRNAYNNLGLIFLKMNQYDSAKGSFLKAAKIDTTFLNPYSSIADIFITEKKYDSAKIYFNKVLLLDSLNTHALNLLSLVAFIQNNVDSSEYFYNRILNMKAASATTYKIGVYISSYYQNLKQYDKEIKIAQRLYDYDSVYKIADTDSTDRVYLLDDLAYAYLYSGQLAQSRHYYTKEGAMQYYYYNLACVASLDKKNDEAIKNLELAFENGYKNYDHLQEDTDLDNIRNTDAYKALLKKYFPDK